MRDTGIEPDGLPYQLRSRGRNRPLTWGPIGDHTLCAIVNDLRVGERVARARLGPSPAPRETGYRHLLGSSGGKRRRSAQAAGSRAPSEEVVVPVDPLHRDVLNVVEGTQGPARNGLRQLMASVLNSPIVVSVGH